VWRERQELRQGKVTEQSAEYSYYCTSAAHKQYNAPRWAHLDTTTIMGM